MNIFEKISNLPNITLPFFNVKAQWRNDELLYYIVWKTNIFRRAESNEKNK